MTIANHILTGTNETVALNTQVPNRLSASRRKILATGLGGAGTIAARSILAGAAGPALGVVLASAASADPKADADADIAVLQTAASLENVAVSTYGLGLGLAFIKNGNSFLAQFMEKTMAQHGEHADAFNAQVAALGGREQKDANVKYAQMLSTQKPALTKPADVVNLAITIEDATTDTYVNDVALLHNLKAKELMAAVMGVVAQQLVILKIVSSVIDTSPDLLALPVDAFKLPPSAGHAGFAGAFQGTDHASPSQEGAIAKGQTK